MVAPLPAELVLTATVARRYYLDGHSKVRIAQDCGISRFKVARLLEAARTSGLVRIEITPPAHIDTELSQALADAFDLQHAIVVNTPTEPETSLRQHLGRVAADLLTEIVEDGDVLGLAWGRTLYAASTALTRLARCTVVQLTGAQSGREFDENSIEIVRRAAGVAGGPAYPIYAPLIVEDATTADALRRQPEVAEAMDRFADVTKALVAVGAWASSRSTIFDAVSDADRQDCAEHGVVAEVSGILIDRDGQAVRTGLSERVIGISADQLRAVPEVIGVAGGHGKAEAIAAALRGRLATSLVTDAATAGDLLAGDGLRDTAGRR